MLAICWRANCLVHIWPTVPWLSLLHVLHLQVPGDLPLRHQPVSLQRPCSSRLQSGYVPLSLLGTKEGQQVTDTNNQTCSTSLTCSHWYHLSRVVSVPPQLANCNFSVGAEPHCSRNEHLFVTWVSYVHCSVIIQYTVFIALVSSTLCSSHVFQELLSGVSPPYLWALYIHIV